MQENLDHTRSILTFAISEAAPDDISVPYPGLLMSFQYADDLKLAMLSQISESVTACEEHARSKTVQGVNTLKKLRPFHLGDEYINLSSKSDVMFRRKRDILARQIKVETEIWDFFDWSAILQRHEKVASIGMVTTIAAVAGGRVAGGFGLMVLWGL
jgi:mitofusin